MTDKYFEFESSTRFVRIPFDIELAKRISAGMIEGRVVTRGKGNGVRINNLLR